LREVQENEGDANGADFDDLDEKNTLLEERYAFIDIYS